MQLQKHSSYSPRPRRQYLALSGLVALLALSCVETPNGLTSPDALVLTSPWASVKVQTTMQLTAIVNPAIASALTWTSSNPSVATVDHSGLVTGVAAGTATITASADGRTSSAELSVLAPGDELLLAAGDIATCTNDFDEATARILDGHPTGTVAPLGDNAYSNGSTTDYANCYQPTWGRHLARTKPAVGNHEYQTPDATGYFAYFGSKAGDPSKAYYSYDLGSWHIIVLNSNIAHDAGSAQVQWLRSDLQANSGKSCTLAYWHHPRFSSGTHGNDSREAAFWETLYAEDVDVIITAHDHSYERFAPQTPDGVANDSRGIRSFVVGTGGTGLRTLGTVKANSQVFNAKAHGVLKMTLSPNGYAWQFLAIAGQNFTDAGSGSCH